MKLPPMVYGTAWKKEATESLVLQAFKAGFVGVDTACQPKSQHYHQPGVGAALKAFGGRREDVWIQTKFTSIDGQDLKKPLPYDKNASVAEQVRQSLNKSFEQIGTQFLDALLLHSPLPTFEKTREAWTVLEEEVDKGRIGAIGISNCYDVSYLQRCFSEFRIPPSIMHNRFYGATQYEKETLAFLQKQPNKPVLQTFWTLTANPDVLSSKPLGDLKGSYSTLSGKELTKEQTLYIFLMRHANAVLDICPLNGTTNPKHMELGIECIHLVDKLKGNTVPEEKQLAEMLWG
ncbi:Aldo/keto reductase [Atractiella rhizophila]|nr:Aldo/keto reductase [Atractiella rhizophila]